MTIKRGLNIPILTLVDHDARVIEEDQRRLIRHVIQEGRGADSIFGVGTTGEWNRLSNPERQRAIKIVVDEIKKINGEPGVSDSPSIESWIGVNGKTRAEVLSNLDLAIRLGADAAVIAPLAIEDLREDEIERFFQREMTDLLESAGRSGSSLPVFLYDNADIAVPGSARHIRTRIVKHLSRIPWVSGIKVSAPRHVLGNYTKAALHYKLPGEFGIYIGNAMLIFEIYRPGRGLFGRLREGWRDYLLHSTPPIGVVSGPANVLPREWQKAWRVCWAGDEDQTDLYHDLCERFERIFDFEAGGKRINKMIACLKYALHLDGVISSHAVAPGTPALTNGEMEIFEKQYRQFRQDRKNLIDELWISR